MKTINFLIPVIAMTFLSSTTSAQDQPPKVLVAYYSWGGNTAVIAEYIREALGADVFVIDPVQPYPAEYSQCTEQAKREINSDFKPALKGEVPDFASYDIVFVGTPNWWSTMAPPVKTFLSEHDFSGKSVVPFVTHGGGGQARCLSDMENYASGGSFLKGLAVPGASVAGAKDDVLKWLREIGVTL